MPSLCLCSSRKGEFTSQRWHSGASTCCSVFFSGFPTLGRLLAQPSLGGTVTKDLKDSFAKVKGNSIRVLETEWFPEVGKATTQLVFSGGTTLRIDYWRIIRKGRERISSFDHEQQYGLPVPIDAIEELRKELDDNIVLEAHLDAETGDLLFQFTGDIKLQIFGFTSYEVWEINFPDGTGEYSNHAKNS